MSLPNVASLEVLDDEFDLEGASGRLLEAAEFRSDRRTDGFRSGSGGGGISPVPVGFWRAALRILAGDRDDSADDE